MDLAPQTKNAEGREETDVILTRGHAIKHEDPT
jgi:hypothetical protein